MILLFTTLSLIFGQLAQRFNTWGDEVTGLGSIGVAIAIACYDVSLLMSNIAQTLLIGAQAAQSIIDRLDALDTLIENIVTDSAIGAIITNIWPDFPLFIANPITYIIDRIEALSTDLVGFFVNPIGWLRDRLGELLPIDISGDGWRTIDVNGVPFYAHNLAPIGDGFELTIPSGNWVAIRVIWYANAGDNERAWLARYRNGEHDANLTTDWSMVAGETGFSNILYREEGLTVGDRYGVIVRQDGPLSFRAQAILLGQPESGDVTSISVDLIGDIGPARWALDWSGFIDWLGDGFPTVDLNLYELCEAILRYFWEGVWKWPLS